MKKLLGRKDKSPKPPTDNPYAQEPANDPYAAYPNAAPKPQVRPPGGLPAGPGGGLPSGPRGGRGGLPSGPARGNSMNSVNSMSSTATGPPPYQAQQAPQPPQPPQPPQQPSGYSNDRYGASGGYGSTNRYGDADSNGGGGGAAAGGYDSSAGRRGPGGYGGLGRTDTMDSGAGKDALFGGGRERMQNAPAAPNGNAGGYGASAGGGYGAGAGGSAGNKYGGYGEERELTEEERIKLEERDLARQIDQERDATVDTGHRILGIINSTIETANGTLQNMAQQDERLRNTERNLDLSMIHNRTAEERTKELKHYNRSLWNPGNPFMSKSKQEERERKHLENTQRDRERREATRKDAYDSQAQYERDMKEIESTMANRRALGLSSSEKAASNNKFVFDESDEEDDNPENMALRADRRAKEDEINNMIMPQMEAGVATLNKIARSFQPRIEESNALIDRIGAKSDTVGDGVTRNRAKLDAIYKKG